jgi:hypothetical protein
MMGRFGDTEVAHVSPGEVVVPRPVLENNPNLGAGIATAISNMGGNPDRYVVGSQSNSINPNTGNRIFLERITFYRKKYFWFWSWKRCNYKCSFAKANGW